MIHVLAKGFLIPLDAQDAINFRIVQDNLFDGFTDGRVFRGRAMNGDIVRRPHADIRIIGDDEHLFAARPECFDHLLQEHAVVELDQVLFDKFDSLATNRRDDGFLRVLMPEVNHAVVVAHDFQKLIAVLVTQFEQLSLRPDRQRVESSSTAIAVRTM